MKQRQWRIAGAVLIVVSAVMAWYGVRWPALRGSAALFFGYWGVFTACLLSAVYCALLDMRFIRMQYAIAERAAFKETLGDEKLRKALREALAKEAKAQRKGAEEKEQDGAAR